MNTESQTSSMEDILLDTKIQPEKPARGESLHPIMRAFGRAQYGQLTVQGPDGRIHKFVGPQIGAAADLQIHDWSALDRFITKGETGFAEAYMEGLWDSRDLVSLLVFGLANAEVLERYFYGRPIYAFFTYLTSVLRTNTIRKSRQNVQAHYDLGNDFYKLWLDESMTYSCGLFGGEIDMTLEDAQQAKYNRILTKLGAKAGDHILEIGCGWGAFAMAAARKGIKVTGVTISDEQKALAEERIKQAGLEEYAQIRLIDYRQVEGVFDHIVSIGMFEHVGEQYWPTYFDTVKARLRPGGKAMIQSITIDEHVFERTHDKQGFIETYIFPGGMLPSRPVFRSHVERAGLVCKEMFTFGQDYARTVGHWMARFNAHEAEVRKLGYNEHFIRMWRFYLSSCIAAFTTARTDVMQAEITHAKDAV
ncbi:MAG TPA: cyclopropane-fatty-acyl-phospholipid synthase family protein [Rickettsiales bacterium]|nr:cyclopropane-fatty-acyl-phospholipid synthase family protein [Rickettsiales bacterium]